MAAAVQEDVQSKVIELTGEAMEAFCDDISTMFEADISCTPKQQGHATLDELKKLFKKVGAVHAVKAEGTLDGMFYMVFDQGGLFTLAGVVVMLPEARIRERPNEGPRRTPRPGPMPWARWGTCWLGRGIGSSGRACPGHKHFVKGSTFIGIPWEKPQDSIGLAVRRGPGLCPVRNDRRPLSAILLRGGLSQDLLTAKPEPEVEEEPSERYPAAAAEATSKAP